MPKGFKFISSLIIKIVFAVIGRKLGFLLIFKENDSLIELLLQNRLKNFS